MSALNIVITYLYIITQMMIIK